MKNAERACPQGSQSEAVFSSGSGAPAGRSFPLPPEIFLSIKSAKWSVPGMPPSSLTHPEGFSLQPSAFSLSAHATFFIDRAGGGEHPASMARSLRLQHPAAVCHAPNRGGRRAANFAGVRDRRDLLETSERQGRGDRRKLPTGLRMAKPDDHSADLECEANGDRRLRLSAVAAVAAGPETQKYDNTTN